MVLHHPDQTGEVPAGRRASLADLVRAWRHRARLTQEQLADQASLGVRTVRDLEGGRVRRPHRATLESVAHALGLGARERAEMMAVVADEFFHPFQKFAPAAFSRPSPEPAPPDGSRVLEGPRALRSATAGPPAPDGPAAGPLLATPAGGPAAGPLLAAPAGGPGRAGSRQPPQELPIDINGFVGRQDHERRLDGLLDRPGRAAPIAVIVGGAGVGKTALAVRWAHRVRARFPDGQLHADLHGYDVDGALAPGDVLAAFLRSLGVPSHDIPGEEVERAARYRTLLADRRVLVLLDNARSVEQVRPLLPATSSCFALVTSRDSVPGLVARNGARRINLDPLPIVEAVDLLRTLVGDRVDTEPEAAVELAECCARLPLALRVAAELAASNATASLAELTAELVGGNRLDQLALGGDPHSAVRAVFSWSRRHLPAPADRAFRLLGLHPGHDFDPHAAAALAGVDLTQVRRLMSILTGAHLVERRAGNRFGMHDLMRAYAAELAAEAPEADRRAALDRLFDHYRYTAAMVMDRVLPAAHDRRPPVPPPAGAPAAVEPPADPSAWLEGERANLVSIAAYTARRGWPAHTIELAAILRHYLNTAALPTDALSIHQHALDAARGQRDLAAQANALNNIGVVCERLGDNALAMDHLRSALAIFRQLGDRYGEAAALNRIGIVSGWLGQYAEATGAYEQALAICVAHGLVVEEGSVRNGLGGTCDRLGRYTEAVEHYERALAISRETGFVVGEAVTLTNLGLTRERQGRYREALERHELAVGLMDRGGHLVGQVSVLTNLGRCYARLGRYAEAIDHHRRALTLLGQLDRHVDWSTAYNDLGETLCLARRAEEAVAHHRSARQRAEKAGNWYELARALDGLGHAHHRLGNLAEARDLWHDALARYAELAVPEAAQVRANLAALSGPP